MDRKNKSSIENCPDVLADNCDKSNSDAIKKEAYVEGEENNNPDGTSVVSALDYFSKKLSMSSSAVMSKSQEALDQVTTTMKESTNGNWLCYQRFIQRNQVVLNLLDEGITRMLFWAPYSSEDCDDDLHHHRWREVLYGLLSLNRLAMDVAATTQDEKIENHYGMTLRPNHGPCIPATMMRIMLTVVHSLIPSLLELCRSSSPSASNDREAAIAATQRQRRRQGYVRVYTERIKFILRVLLLIFYHRQLKQEQQKQQEAASRTNDSGNDEGTTRPVIGIMQTGGMFEVGNNNCFHNTPTISKEKAYRKRKEYVGRRTGRRVVPREEEDEDDNDDDQLHQLHQNQQRRDGKATNRQPTLLPVIRTSVVLFGELLYAYRPLFWATSEAKIMNRRISGRGNTLLHSYKAWVSSLGMDIISLLCLAHVRSNNGCNHLTKGEIDRRKLNLFLYLLRSPIWDSFTEPKLETIATNLIGNRIPVIGKLVETYIWDYITYYKHPYVSEEG